MASIRAMTTQLTRVLGHRSEEDIKALGDARLLELAKSGRENAARELLERYGHRLLSIVEATHGDLAISEDIVQETFIRAIQQGHQLREESSSFPWLVRIALRVAIDFRRKVRRETLTEVMLDVPDEAAGPERTMEAAEDAARVKRALEQLKPYRRELMILRYFASFSVMELAEVFQKSETAVRKDLQRAREDMREELADWFEAGGAA
jgi:RNA polymerase sigma-70 factor (ECF subfamily)